MSKTTKELVDRLATSEETGLDATLLIPLLRLLVDGAPVAVGQLATASGHSVEEVRAGLAAVPDTEYDDAGRIVGQGLTLRPTTHRFTVGGQGLYTWCALDTLMFPVIIDRVARVESASAASGAPVRVTVEPDGLASVEPATAVVSVVNPDDITSIRSSFCNLVHFFTSVEDADPWLADHPDAELLSVAEAFRLGVALATNVLNGPQPNNTGSTPDRTRCRCDSG